MGFIRVKRFRASWSNWDISWPWSESGKSTIRLPVSFRLELEPGSSKDECMVGQFKRGLMSDASGTEKFPNWTIDGPTGDAYWWNGSRMSSAGYGEWDSAGLVATFEDKPGFNGAKGALLLATWNGGPGYFEWKTQVVRRNGYEVLAEILWFMRIDVPNPGKGGNWWSYSNQK